MIDISLILDSIRYNDIQYYNIIFLFLALAIRGVRVENFASLAAATISHMSHSKVKRESRKNVVWKKSELEGMKTINNDLKTREINNGIISLIEAKILLKFS